MEKIKITTWRFGDIEVNKEDVFSFTRPILGFPGKRYILIEEVEQEPFLWLQSLDEPEVSFVMIDPLLFYPDYKVEVNPEEVEDLEFGKPEEAKVLVILVVPEDPSKITANLQGPVIFNLDKHMAKQIVLQDDRYPLRYPLGEKVANSETEKEKD